MSIVNPFDPIPAASGSAAGRPWVPKGALGPIAVDLSKPAGAVRVSVHSGSLLRVEVVPANPDAYIALGRLPTSAARAGAFCASFWDLPGVQAIAAAMRHEVVLDAAVQDLCDRWARWCLDLEHTKNHAEYPGFRVPGLDIEFLDFQARGVQYGMKIGSFLLLDAMGTGKSVQALGIIFTHRQAMGGRCETLILSPTSVTGDWARKFQQFAKIDVAVASGSPTKRLKIYESHPEFLIVSYDTFSRDAAHIAKNFHPKLVIGDEAQRLVNRKTKATSRLLEYISIVKPKHIIMASGSPIANRPDDIWPVLRMINPELAGAATAFEKRYLKSKPVKWVRDEATGKMKPWTRTFGTGDKAREYTPMKLESLSPNKPAEAALLSELRMKIAPYVIRRLKRDVLKSLPGKIHERLDIRLGSKERKAYEELQARFAEAMAGVGEEGAETEETFFSWFIKAQQICSSLEILALGEESAKIAELKEFVEDNAGDEKILIFSRFKTMTDIVCRELKEYKPIHLHGGVPQAKRQALVDDFQEKDEHRIFAATLASGGIGLTLTAASIVVRLDRWVAPTLNEQAEDRADRIGQKSIVTVVDFVVEDSVEERILEMLAKKQRMIASLISVDGDGETQEKRILKSMFRKKDMLGLI